MSGTNTATKSPSDELREVQANLTRLEQELAKTKMSIREKRAEVLRIQSKGMGGGSLQEAYVNATIAGLELADLEGDETRITQAVSRARQNVDFCDRRYSTELKNARVINVNRVA